MDIFRIASDILFACFVIWFSIVVIFPGYKENKDEIMSAVKGEIDRALEQERQRRSSEEFVVGQDKSKIPVLQEEKDLKIEEVAEKTQSLLEKAGSFTFKAPNKGDYASLSYAGQIYDWVMGLDLMEKGDDISKDQIADKGDLDFRWEDSEIKNDITIDEDGKVDWRALSDFPSACPDGQAVSAVGDSLTCIDVSPASPSTEWLDIQSFPSGCGANQAVQTIGGTLTCIDLPSGGSSLFTDSGNTTHLTSTTDDVALGGSDATAPFYFDAATGNLKVNNITVGGDTDSVTINSNGFVQFNGDSTLWDDYRVPVTSTTKGGSKEPAFGKFRDDGSGSQGVFTYFFDAIQEEELYFDLQLPHKYKEGSDLYPHIHWIPYINGDAGQKVSWGLECSWSNFGGVFPNTSILYANTPALNETLVAGKQYITPFASMDGTGKEVSSMLMCRVFRNATGSGASTDDYASDAGLLEIDFHYEMDKLGTETEY